MATNTPAAGAAPEFITFNWDRFYEMLERRDADMMEELGGIDGLVTGCKSDKLNGIDPSTFDARFAQFGPNLLRKKEPATFLEFVIEALEDRVVQILCGAAILSIIFGLTLPNPHTGVVEYSHGWIEGVAICISVLVVVLTGSINNYQKAKKFEEMEKEQAVKSVQITRGGAEVTVTSDTLVPGDLLSIEYGMELSIDGLVVAASDLKMNESALTGEPDLIKKHPGLFVIAGTSVEEGSGKVIVLATGMNSQQGRSKESVDEDPPETPLQEHLDHLAGLIGYFGFATAAILIIALSIKEGVLISQGKTASAISFLNFVLIAITVIAVAIPEGLPLAVTIALAYSMKAMMVDNCMVRVLASCETMGAATAICSDKTGTLTTNEMTMVQFMVAEEEVVIDGYGVIPRNSTVTVADRNNVKLTTSDAQLHRFLESMAVNSTARQTTRDGKLIWVGNKTDQGMIRFFPLVGQDYVAMREKYGEANTRQFPFNSTKKQMATIVRNPTTGEATMHVKGASEVILAACKFYVDRNGAIQKLTDALKDQYNDVIVDMANQGNRTIAIASQSGFPGMETSFPEEAPDAEELVLLGICGIQDPIRQEVPASVNICHKAGLVVRMVTGDNINTARSIGRKCNIYHDDGFDVAIEGPMFRKWASNPETREQLKALLPRMKVLARSSPTDKLTLVELLQELGEVVGVTGDGTNDAPALKTANVGLAMADGTDIAKGAAAMILLDNNFVSVQRAIMWGRAVNDNIKRFLQFQLTINCAGVGMTLVGAIASSTSKEPLNPVQLLWLNLIMDTLAALSLATESPNPDCMNDPPVYKDAPIITNKMRVFIIIHGCFQFALMLAIQFEGHKWFQTVDDAGRCDRDIAQYINGTILNTTSNRTYIGQITNPDYASCKKTCEFNGGHLDGRYCIQGTYHSTMLFNIFIWFQIFNVINARKLLGEMNPLEGTMTRSRNLIIIFMLIAGLQALAVEVTGDFMGTQGLKGRDWGICIGFGALELILGFIVRIVQQFFENSIPESVTESHVKLSKLRESVSAGHEPSADEVGKGKLPAASSEPAAAAVTVPAEQARTEPTAAA